MNNPIELVMCSDCEEKPVYARGLCRNCYRSKIRYGEIEKIKGDKRECGYKGCNLPTEVRNVCHIHYNRRFVI